MRIAIVTDAWSPQVNGVVRTLQATRAELERMGHKVLVISPDLFPSLPCPTYPEIRLAFAGTGAVGCCGIRPAKGPGGGGGLTHCTTTSAAVPGAPRLMARQYEPSS